MVVRQKNWFADSGSAGFPLGWIAFLNQAADRWEMCLAKFVPEAMPAKVSQRARPRPAVVQPTRLPPTDLHMRPTNSPLRAGPGGDLAISSCSEMLRAVDKYG